MPRRDAFEGERPYAAKRIPVHDVAARAEALAEAQLLSKIKHPNVIAYKESFLSSPEKEEEEEEEAVRVGEARDVKSASRLIAATACAS